MIVWFSDTCGYKMPVSRNSRLEVGNWKSCGHCKNDGCTAWVTYDEEKSMRILDYEERKDIEEAIFSFFYNWARTLSSLCGGCLSLDYLIAEEISARIFLDRQLARSCGVDVLQSTEPP